MTSPASIIDLHTLLLFSTHGSVCGCPSFWGLPPAAGASSCTPPSTPTTTTLLPSPPTTATTTTTTVQASPLTPTPKVAWHSTSSPPSHSHSHSHSHSKNPTTMSTLMQSPYTFPTPPGPPKETCFFWYHGVCKRDQDCPFEHKAHITWPITVPRGYVHWEVCCLPLCPLRDGFGEIEGRICGVVGGGGMKKDGDIGGGGGGGVDGVKKDGGDGEGVKKDVKDGERERLKDEGKKGKEKTKKKGKGKKGEKEQRAADETAKTAIGTKRELADGSLTAIAFTDLVGQNGTGHDEEQHDMDMDMITFTPTSNPASSSSSRTATAPIQENSLTQISHSGTNHRNHRAAKPNRTAGPSKHKVRSNPFQGPPLLELPRPTPNPPLGPRSHKASWTCFYWYHQGYCTRHMQRKCPYTHNARLGLQRVARPLNHVFDKHDPACKLRLCPVFLQRIEDEKMRIRREREEVAETISRILNPPPSPAKTKKIKYNGGDKRIAEKNGEVFVPKKLSRDALRRARRARSKRKALAREALETPKSVKPVPRTLEYGPPS